MLPLAFNPTALSEAYNLPMGIDLDRMTERDNVSYFRETMSYLSEMQKEFNTANISFYRGIVESAGNEIVIQESFGDFFNKIKEIIEKFLKFIKSLFDRFLTNLNGFIKREKYLLKHESDFAKFSNIHEFRYSGYNFSFSPEIPVINALAEFDYGFIFNVGDDTKPTAIPDETTLKTSLTTLNNTLNNGDWYDKFRARVIGDTDGIILKSDFATELTKIFRSGDTSREDFDVTSSVVNEALSRFKAHSNAVSSARRTKESIDSEYGAVKKRLENMLKINYADGTKTATIYGSGNTTKVLSGAEISLMDLFVKAKVSQVQEMSNIHALAFSAKLDALNDCFKQDKAVLYKALSKIQGTIGEEV